MRKLYQKCYRFVKPPQELGEARLDLSADGQGNIAIVPASMLPLEKTIQELINTLPQGTVLLCYTEENTRQRKLLKRLEQKFRQQGHAVRSLSYLQAIRTIP